MMLNTKKRPLIAAALLLTSFGITTSCIDNSYDLNKDIDMTISAGGEHLAIPCLLYTSSSPFGTSWETSTGTTGRTSPNWASRTKA